MPLSKSARTNPTSSNWTVFAVLFFAGLLAYMPALQGDFLWDDTYLVGQNPFFKSPIFIFEVFRHYLFLDSFSIYYRPVQNISYMFDYWLWNRNPFGYHLSNIAYHVFAAFFLFLLLKALLPGFGTEPKPEKAGQAAGRSGLLAFLVALVWVVHPIHNAAVAYIAGRADSIACALAIAAWLVWLKAPARRAAWAKWALYFGAWACCLLALCAKEIAFIWMLLFLLHLLGFNRDLSVKRKIGAVVGVLLVPACYLVLRSGLSGGLPMPGDGLTFSGRFMFMLRALGDYTWLIFYPNVLHMDRLVFSPDHYASVAAWEQNIRYAYLPVIGTLTLVVFVWMCLNKRPVRRLRIFAALWFVFGFLPISNLFPLNAQVAEHWIYMPSMGLLLFLAGCVLAFPARIQSVAAVIVAIAVIPLTIRTAKRSYEWADNERFYLQTIAAGGGSTRINLNLALVYEGRGEIAKAEAMLRDIVQRFPDYMPARLNLGIVLRDEGKTAEAERLFNFDKAKADKIAKQYSHTWTGTINMAQLRFSEKKYDESLALLDDALKRFPGVWEITAAKARELQQLGRSGDATKVVKAYADAHWWYYPAFVTLAQVEVGNGQTDAALADFHHAALLDIHASEPYNKIARVYFGIGRFQEACDAQQKAIRRDPNQPTQYIYLSAIFDAMNRKDESAAAMRHAEELRKAATGAAAQAGTEL